MSPTSSTHRRPPAMVLAVAALLVLLAAIALGDALNASPGLDTAVSNNAYLSLRWSTHGNFVRLTNFYDNFSDYINLVNTGLEEGQVSARAAGPLQILTL